MKTSQRSVARRWSSVAERWSEALQSRALQSRIKAASGDGSFASPTLHGTFAMDMTWVTGRIAVGGGIWKAENMAEVAQAGVTHIVDMQVEFDDTALAEPHGIEVLWNPTDDDFQLKPPEIFERGVDFARGALDQQGTKLFVHCAAGVHRAPMMTLAILCSLSWEMGKAMQLIEARRPVVDFADVYVRSVNQFLKQQTKTGKKMAGSLVKG